MVNPTNENKLELPKIFIKSSEDEIFNISSNLILKTKNESTMIQYKTNLSILKYMSSVHKVNCYI